MTRSRRGVAGAERRGFRVEHIVSGGQSGVDRAALDAALELGLPCGGWCPKGRKSEDGPIDARYPLRETPSSGYEQRTEWNVRDSDATLVIARGRPRKGSGTAYTLGLARQLGKPHLLVDPEDGEAARVARDWLEKVRPAILNVAGPRESQSPGIGEQARLFLHRCLASNGDR